MSAILTCKQIGDVRIQCALNLKALLYKSEHRESFVKKWPEFLASHPDNKDVFSLDRDNLQYSSEQLIPRKIDERPALLLVLGNPATQSIKSGMFFSYERDKKEHRFWKDILGPANILSASCDAGSSIEELNAARRDQIMDLTFSENKNGTFERFCDHEGNWPGTHFFNHMPVSASRRQDCP